MATEPGLGGRLFRRPAAGPLDLYPDHHRQDRPVVRCPTRRVLDFPGPERRLFLQPVHSALAHRRSRRRRLRDPAACGGGHLRIGQCLKLRVGDAADRFLAPAASGDDAGVHGHRGSDVQHADRRRLLCRCLCHLLPVDLEAHEPGAPVGACGPCRGPGQTAGGRTNPGRSQRLPGRDRPRPAHSDQRHPDRRRGAGNRSTGRCRPVPGPSDHRRRPHDEGHAGRPAGSRQAGRRPHDGRPCGLQPAQPADTDDATVARPDPGQGPETAGRGRSIDPGGRPGRSAAGAPDTQQPRLQRDEIHRDGLDHPASRGLERRTRWPCGADHRRGHRPGHDRRPARPAVHALRSDPVGSQCASRRHRTGPCHQPPACRTDGWTVDRSQQSGHRHQLHPVAVPAAGPEGRSRPGDARP